MSDPTNPSEPGQRLDVLTADDLYEAGRDLRAPFAVAADLGHGVRRFQVERILRLLPGRRLVARVLPEAGDGEPQAAMLLKLFYGPGAESYCARERAGYERLAAASLRTPPLVAAGATALGYRWLDLAQPVDELQDRAIDAALDAIGLLHHAGLLQTDMHLENFLDDGERVWVVDPDGIQEAAARQKAAPAYRDNLAVFFAQLPPSADRLLPGRLMRYCHSARIATDSEEASLLAAQLPVAVARARHQRLERYLDKTLRDCTAFALREGRSRRFLALRAALGPELKAFAEDPEQLLEQSVVLKAGNTATVMRVDIDGASRIVKRYNIKSAAHRLRQSLRRSSRGERSWRNGHRLDFLRLPTARPLALLETRRSGLRDLTYLVTEDLGSTDLNDWLAHEPLDAPLLEQIEALLQGLRDCRLLHGDLKATNLLLHDKKLHLIDLDSLRPVRSGYEKDLKRFLANWPADSEVGRQLRARLG